MPKKTIWYCPCDCKTPKGMKKKFYIISSLLSHIIDVHSTQVDMKFMYKLKLPSDGIVAVGKKRYVDEYEDDGFKEILSVEEEEEELAIGAEVDNLRTVMKDVSI